MTKSNFLYLFPSNYDHEGINVKLDGQLDALNTKYNVKLVTLKYRRHQSAIAIFWALFSFECKAIYCALLYPTIYMRYNPKTPYTMLFLGFLSFFKRIYIEHNTLLDNELRFLGRRIERLLHHIIMFFLSKSNVTHISVNEELKEHLETRFSCSKNKSVYLQNGFKMPKINPNRVQQPIIDKIKSLDKKIAIFTGNGYPWHGLETLIDLVKDRSDLHLLVAGPYKTEKDLPPHIHLLGKLDTATLYTVYEHCDFAISTFRWDMLNITDGSPLKTREYLGLGLPILTNYHDSAEDFDSLQPYIFNYKKDPQALEQIIRYKGDKDRIKDESKTHLSWLSIWKNSILMFRAS